jgi:predicted metal-dependent peptidase
VTAPAFVLPIAAAATPEDKLAEFRAIVRLKAGYVSSILYGLVPYFVKGKGTMGVTPGLVHIIDPDWIMKFNEFEGAFLYMHEISHILRDSAGRRGDRDRKLWNWACDIPINDDLIEAGWTPPGGDDAPMTAATWGFPKGLIAEEYYNLLVQQQKKKTPAKSAGGKAPQEDCDGTEKKEAAPDDPPHLCSGHCGGVAGNPDDAEETLDKEVGRTQIDRKAIQRQALDDIRQAAAQSRGNMPAGFRSLITLDKKRSRIPWYRKLVAFLRRATGQIQSGGLDFSISRPSHGSYARGIPRPGLIQQEPVVLFIEDTSGSMGHPQLKTVRREARAIMLSLGLDKVWWMDADAAVAAPPRQVSVRDLERLPIHGGGGTDFRPALEAGLKLRPRPDIIVYLTDGDGTAPETAPPGVVVVWCIVPSYFNRRPASWGHAVIMRQEGDENPYPQYEDDEDDDDEDE